MSSNTAHPARQAQAPKRAGASENVQDASQIDPWQEPVRGGYPSPQHFELPGIGQLQALISGEVPAPPISHLTGMHITEAQAGTATFQMPLSPWLCSSQGPITLGALTMPADAAVACAIQSELPSATRFTTSELSLRLLSPVAPGSVITARGRLISLRRTIALAEVSLSTEGGHLVAHGSSLCFVQQPAAAASRRAAPSRAAPSVHAPPPATSSPAPATRTLLPDPHERTPRGQVLAPDVWTSLSGREVLEAQLAGDLPAPPIHHLIGLALASIEEDGVRLTMPASEWLCAPARLRVQGGAVALLADAAIASAIQAKLPSGTALAPIDLKANYLRPLSADGSLVRAQGRVVHLGRRIAVATATVIDSAGAQVALATGSAMLLPGRDPSLGVRCR